MIATAYTSEKSPQCHDE